MGREPSVSECLKRTVDDKDLARAALEDGVSEVVEAARCAEGRVLAKVSAPDASGVSRDPDRHREETCRLTGC